MRLYDPNLRVYTHDFQFQDIDMHSRNLPGVFAENPPKWAEAAVCAHANAADVARFLKTVLRRNGLDNLGGVYVSSVCCCSAYNGGHGRAWHNAAWIGTQMVYGQRRVGCGDPAEFHSYARAADVVAHEIFHGVTTKTARLQYQGMTGALNESYSDIFGILVSNHGKLRDKWDWRMGEDLNVTGIPIRDLSDPTLHDQPGHMDKYDPMPLDKDHGGVHKNSGLHNKAFHLLAATRDAAGQFLIDETALAALFYLALTQHLSHRSTFGDSRRAVELVTRTYYRTRSDPKVFVDAVSAAFDAVGITPNRPDPVHPQS